MPAHRKPPGTHVRRGGPSSQHASTSVLDAYGRTEPFPPAELFDLDDELAEKYAALWESVTAIVWLVSDAPLVVEYLRLRRLVDRMLVEGTEPKGTTLSRLGVIEDRLLLSPKSRHAAGLRISGSEFGELDE